jgi:hypothetical protein
VGPLRRRAGLAARHRADGGRVEIVWETSARVAPDQADAISRAGARRARVVGQVAAPAGLSSGERLGDRQVREAEAGAVVLSEAAADSLAAPGEATREGQPRPAQDAARVGAQAGGS